MDPQTPYLIEFDSIGSLEIGYISVGQELDKIPFKIKRAYWTYFTPQSVIRGGHANVEKEMVLIAVAGKIVIETEIVNGLKNSFVIENPKQGLYMPRLCWHTMQYSHNAVQLVIASTTYDESDYIRDYEQFKSTR